ncbi:MAG: sodium:solute symporter family protein [Armatimonadetes bacterium]|nr:sodium:solute symporter family protein [Armatimonadota bacterium]
MDPLAQAGLQNQFGAFDWLVVVLFIVSVTAIGIYARRWVVDMDDYVVAGRAVRVYLGVATMVATEMGLVTVMYSAQKGFTSGFAAFHIALAGALVALLVGRTGFIVVPLRRSGAMTIPEYFEQRYSRGVRMLGGAILAFSGILNMGMFLKADSLFVTSLMGMTDPTTLKLAMTIMLGLVLLYTMLGGMIAVLVTDYLQFCVMALVLVGTSLFLMTRYSWGELIQTVETFRGDAGINPFAAGGFGAAYVVWMFFLGLVSCALWQTAALRAASAEDEATVRKTYSWSSLGFLIRFMIPYFWGICALAYVASHPALRAVLLPPGGEVPSELSLRAMPIALGSLIPAGALGVLSAGMLAAAMSTYNSYLHCWSAVICHDVLVPLWGQGWSSRKRILLTQVVMAAIGGFLLFWGLWYPLGEDLWDYMAVTGAIYFTGAFACLVGGLYWRRASTTGAYAAFLCGLSALLGLAPLQRAVGVEWNSEHVGLATVALTALVMVVVSLLCPDREVAA